MATSALCAPTPASSAATVPEDTYIVVFERGLDTPDDVVSKIGATLKQLGAKINYEYKAVVKGFSVSAPTSAIEHLKGYNDADYPFVIEKDQRVSTW